MTLDVRYSAQGSFVRAATLPFIDVMGILHNLFRFAAYMSAQTNAPKTHSVRSCGT